MPPQLMSTANQSSFQRAVVALAMVCYAAVLVFTAPPVATTQSRILPPQRSANSNTSPKRQRVATLRASDSPEGSRVALTTDQSLNDYEAYRRGDRFYVRIPPANVPRPEAVRRCKGSARRERHSCFIPSATWRDSACRATRQQARCRVYDAGSAYRRFDSNQSRRCAS